MSRERATTSTRASARTLASMKRDTLAAELEADPQLSSAKRQQRSAALSDTMKHAALERKLTRLTASNLELEAKVKEKDHAIERLEKDRRYLSDRETELQRTLEEERTTSESQMAADSAEVQSLRTALRALREEHADLKDEHATISRTTTQTIAVQQADITRLTRQAEHLEDELAGANMMTENSLETIRKLEEDVEVLTAARDALKRDNSDNETMSVVRDELIRQATYLKTLESHNLKLTSELTVLRERHISLEVLREEKRGLESKIKNLESFRERVVRLEAELEASKQERTTWASRQPETPTSMSQNVIDLRFKYAQLLEDHGAANAALKARESELSDLQAQVEQLEATVETLNDEVKASKVHNVRLEHQIKLAEQEIAFRRALVASYDAEVARQDEANVDIVQSQRIQELEGLLTEHKSLNAQLSSASASASQAHAEEAELERQEKLRAQEALEEATKGVQKHLDLIEELEQKLFELSGEIAGGRHIPPGVRVLALRDNPEQQWVDLRQAAMDRLRSENEALLRRLKELDERGVSTISPDPQTAHSDLVPRESFELVQQEKLELEDTVKQREKRLLRLQQIFTAKSAEFREAVSSILGVKLAFRSNGRVMVTSVYDMKANFEFQPSSSSDGMQMQLVGIGEGGPEDLSSMMQYWIATEQCIPGFLASVTLECYDKSKQE